MPMTQADIQAHYRDCWEKAGRTAARKGVEPPSYSSPIEDAVIYPVYERLLRNVGVAIDGGRVLDVGCGSGRWVRFFLDRFTPESIVGVDFAESSVELLTEWSATVAASTELMFKTVDITSPEAPGAFDRRFDLINVGNVLFHVPEPDKYIQALRNLAQILAAGGRIVTTEYLPRVSMRTNWMLVRSRYEFEAACAMAGLEIVDICACSFFSNDPMGIDGPDNGARQRFNAVRTMTTQLMKSIEEAKAKAFVTSLMAEIELACLDFARERMAQIDMPAQKLVVLRAK